MLTLISCIFIQILCINGSQTAYLYTFVALSRRQKSAFRRVGSLFGADTKHVRSRFRIYFALPDVKHFLFRCFFSSRIFVTISLSFYQSTRYRKSLRFFRPSRPPVGNKRFSAFRKYKMSAGDILYYYKTVSMFFFHFYVFMKSHFAKFAA